MFTSYLGIDPNLSQRGLVSFYFFSYIYSKFILQSNLDYPDSLGPHEKVRIIEGPVIENMNINEAQNPAKLVKLRKRHLIVKQHFYKSFGIQYLHPHFYLFWKERMACALKTSRSWINFPDASFFVYHKRRASHRGWNFT